MGSVYITVETHDSVELFLLLAADGDSAGPSTAHTVPGQTDTLACTIINVATDTTYINAFVFLFFTCTADCANIYMSFSPILTAATDGTTSGTKPTRNALGSNVVHELVILS